MTKTKVFRGANVFMSRNLVAPDIFDALLDALKLNGAEIFLCCDPSRNGPNDFHIISSIDHEKFDDLRAKGCNLLGPQSVLSCAKENKALPKQGFICCLAMDGLKVLASGFEMDEKVKIGKLVTAMGGVLHTKASSDVSFVIVKNVLAAKYKWALNILKKPIVTINWLYQCWNEHRIVPQEAHRVLPFSGLTICVTRIPADERKEIQKLIVQNGGKYSAELTKNCTHLISDSAEGDKYKVARKWGHIHIVTRKWFDQSIARRACLNEESYPVQGGLVSSNKGMKTCLTGQHVQDKVIGNSVPKPSAIAAESSVPCSGFGDLDVEATLSQNMSSMFSDSSAFVKEGDGEVTACTGETNVDADVANDSQSEDNDLYLSECRILLIGFEASEMRKLVNLVRKGGGSRYMSFNDKLTHIIVGAPSEIEKKEARSLAASGVIQVVRTNWLEDCDHERKEVPICRRHIAYDLLLPKDSLHSSRGAVNCMVSVNQGKSSVVLQPMPLPPDPVMTSGIPATKLSSSFEKNTEEKAELKMNGCCSVEVMVEPSNQRKKLMSLVNDKIKDRNKLQHDSSVQSLQCRNSTVFKGRTFCFSDCFPEDRRAEVLQWINQGGGEVVNKTINPNVHFTIECHGGAMPSSASTTYVSSHWVRSCLEDGQLLDVGSHILYSPLSCQIPLPRFESFRFCVSQYEEKDRILLRNLCFVLGARFVERLTRKVTHLLCKYTSGPKYEAACKWGICSVTSEWIYECVKQNQVVSMDPFYPKEVTTQDREAGLYTASQFPSQALKIISEENSSQFIGPAESLRVTLSKTLGSNNGSLMGSLGEDTRQSNAHCKKARLLDDDRHRKLFSSEVSASDGVCNVSYGSDSIQKDAAEVAIVVPDVAAAIEDLLEQTSKIHDQKSLGRSGCDKSLFSSDCNGVAQDNRESCSVIGLSRHWLNRTVKNDDHISSASKDVNVGIYGGFSETQTDSQVVGYEEDLSGRQMLIDRVRTRSSMT